MSKGTIAGISVLAVGALAFFGLDGIGKIKSAFADDSPSSQANESPVDRSSNTEKIDVTPKNNDDDSKTNNIVILQEGTQTKNNTRTNEKNDVLILTKTSPALSSDRVELPKSTQGVQVRKPEFTTPEERANPVTFNERKFGINEEKLQIAVTKSPAARSIDERKLIEAEKAREIFDSRSITNF